MAAMAALLAHPLRLRPGGQLSTVDEGSDAHAAQDIAVLIGTRPGERDLVPEFGLEDPAFDELHIAELTAQVAVYGPARTITDIATSVTRDGTATSVVTFT